MFYKITHSTMKISGLPELRPGDLFAIEGTKFYQKLFGFFQWVWDKCGKWRHAGIVTDEKGNTVEALWKVQPSSLKTYNGLNVIIIRWNGMTPEAYAKGMAVISEDMGEDYPWWKLPLFLFPTLAHLVSTGKFKVCSELDFKFLIGSGFDKLNDGDGDDDWRGRVPDDVGLLPIKFPDDFTVVFNTCAHDFLPIPVLK